MNIKETPRAKRFYAKRPIVEVYNGYEIRRYEGMFEVIASIGIYGYGANHIEDCRKFIDKLVKLGIKQDDDEEIAKLIFHVKPYDKINFNTL